MKFGKRLQQQIEETLPEWQDKFLSYKQLKKRLKLIAAECFTDHPFGGHQEQQQRRRPANSSNESSGSVTGPAASNADRQFQENEEGRGLTSQEVEFIRLLNLELEKFNAFFIDKEEEYVIRLQELKERIERARVENAESSLSGGPYFDEEMLNIWKDLVTFHGEMVLLENYSSLNYTGLVKILKKHDKTTGALLRLPFIRKVLHQPFYKTELLSKLVRECESNLQSIFPAAMLGETVIDAPVSMDPAKVRDSSQAGVSSSVAAVGSSSSAAAKEEEVEEQKKDLEREGGGDGERAECSSPKQEDGNMEGIYRSTVAALHTIQELRKGSSTYSPLSLPLFNREENLGVVVDESTVSC
ncbi:SPX domain-containing protein 1 [Selaginella moellendorffii]|uniref:SPX domain-containing protein 1 n=1 Tax=Selaginella moellendorffii TaxID=88036 RepID=UPI000D1C793B|nr:SPX domain-containing protein 1 [Selaginella moellendorffii]|eukprot:XP_024526864.1 SPX domain-containing protein 1 [Selaginella moellendorffii]